VNSNTKREIMLSHYQNPKNMEIPKSKKYLTFNTRNESCIDNLDLYLQLNEDVITDIKFTGDACAIATSSASIMSELLVGKNVDEALNVVMNFELMTKNKDYNTDLMKDANAFDEIHKQPNRVLCACLAWNGIKKALEKKT